MFWTNTNALPHKHENMANAMLREGSEIPRKRLENSSSPLSLLHPKIYVSRTCSVLILLWALYLSSSLEVPSTRSYFIRELKFQPLNMLQNQIKLQIILFWKPSVICNCNTDRGKNTLILSPLLWIPIFSVQSECQSCIPWNQIKKEVSCNDTGYDTDSIRHWGV